MKANKILVPLDGSELAEAAIADALDAANRDSASLMLVRATEARVLPGVDPINAQIEAVDDAEDYLAGVKANLEKRGFRNVETHVYKVDLIVMSTHGRTGFGRLVWGSVAESVLRGTTVPILLLRPSEAPVELPATPSQPKEVLR